MVKRVIYPLVELMPFHRENIILPELLYRHQRPAPAAENKLPQV